MAKLTFGPTWTERVDEGGRPLPGPPPLPLSAQSRQGLLQALHARADADPRVLFEQRFDRGPWWVYLRFGEVAGRIECIGVEVMGNPDGKDQAPLTALAVRRLPVGRLVDRARREYRERLQAASGLDPSPGDWNPDTPQEERQPILDQLRAGIRARLPLVEREFASERKGRPSLYGPEHFARVVEVYLKTLSAGGNPTAEVARRFGVTRSAAAKWVARAREMGLLPPTTRGRAGAIPAPTPKGRRRAGGAKPNR